MGGLSPVRSAISDNARLRQGAGRVRHGENAQGRGDRRRRAFMSTTLSWVMIGAALTGLAAAALGLVR
jgi:hypothetical protein